MKKKIVEINKQIGFLQENQSQFEKLKSTFIKPSAFTSSTAVMSAPGMSSPGAFSAVEIVELSSIKKNFFICLQHSINFKPFKR